MTARLKTFDAKNSPIWTLEKFSGSEIGEYVVTASMARRRSTVPLTLVLLSLSAGSRPQGGRQRQTPCRSSPRGKALEYHERYASRGGPLPRQ